MNSYVAKASTIERKWFVVDAEGKTLGRLASEVAAILRGKRKPTFTPFLDCGDYVIVVTQRRLPLPVRSWSRSCIVLTLVMLVP